MGYRDKKISRCPWCGSHKGVNEVTYKSRWHDDNGVWWVDLERCLVCKNIPDCGQVIDILDKTVERVK